MGLIETLGAIKRNKLHRPSVGYVTDISRTEPPTSTLSTVELLKKDTALRTQFRNSFMFGVPMEGKVVQITDHGEIENFVCAVNGQGAPSIWLPPNIWASTLKDFVNLMNEIELNRKYLEIVEHVRDNSICPDKEWILLKPLQVVTHNGRFVSNSSLGISQLGRVSFWAREIGAIELGYLSPDRASKKLGYPI